MSNTTLTPSIITKEALVVLKNSLVMAKNVTREYDSRFAVSGAKIGATANLRKQPRYLGREGESLQVEGANESFVPLTINRLSGVDITFSTTDLTLNVNDFREQFLKPAMVSLANKIDSGLTELYKDINRLVNAGAGAASYGTSGYLNDGTHNTLAAVQSQILTAGAILSENGAPQDRRAIVLDPMSQVSVITPMTALFNPASKVGGIFESGVIGNSVLGFDFAMDQNIKSFTPLAAGTFAALAAVPASGDTTLTVTATGTSVLPKGTVFSYAGVYAINPQSRLSTGRLMQFVVTADTTLAASSTNVVPFYPPYIPTNATGTTAQMATCTGTPTSTAVITMYSGAAGAVGQSQNLAFQKGAFALATVDQELPGGVHFAARENYEGFSIRIVRQYDINSNQIPARIECLWGCKTIYPELAVRLGG
jgi:hypothetical protein